MTVGARADHPVRSTDRLTHVDALRGVALLGILVVNLLAFSGPSFTFVPPLTYWEGLDRWVEWGILIAAEGAFYTIFSVLFGWGFGRWMRTRGPESADRFTRRLGWLLVIGFVHLFGIWSGDILVQYALTGFLLLPFAAACARTMASWSVGLWLVGIVLFATATGSVDSDNALRWVELYRTGTFAEVLQTRLELGGKSLIAILAYLPIVLALFLFGAALAKVRAFERVPEQGTARTWLVRSLFVTLPVGVALKALYAVDLLGGDASRRLVLSTSAGGPLLGLGYLALLTLWLTASGRGARALRIERGLAAAGRMALTVYLMQSGVMTLVFFGYGLGWYGVVGPTLGLPIALGVFLLQVLAARWWLARYRFGPVEWLWRSLTYGEAQPFRRNG